MIKLGAFKYYIAGVIAFVVWGAFAIPLKLLKDYSSLQILQYRIFTALIVIALFILIGGRSKLKKDITFFKNTPKKERLKLSGLIVLSSILLMSNWFTFIYAVNHVSLTSAAFAYMVCPLITAFGGFFILKEHLTLLKLIGLGIALVSILLLATGSVKEVLWSIGIASVYAFYLIIQRFITQVDKLNMLAINLAISALIMLPYFFVANEAFPIAPLFWITIFIIALVFTLVPLFLNLYALIELPSSTLGIIMYINPIIAFLVAFFYFDEHFHLNQLLAYGLLLIAIVIFNWGVILGLLNSKKRSKHE
ncbi:chloramphenicol-sensitive protein RarD [Pedobacter sp. CG_S7]|uniref:EamA family transporter n=1 Tax=Pedobacter sp. CG_S7 TaxID=3143930 RepID=UPI00339A47DC